MTADTQSVSITITIKIPADWKRLDTPHPDLYLFVSPTGTLHRISHKGSIHSVSPLHKGEPAADGHLRIRILVPGGTFSHFIPAVLIANTFIGERPDDHQLFYRDGNSSNLSPSNIGWRPISVPTPIDDL